MCDRTRTHDGIVILPANGYRRERWPHGAGWTRCIASGEQASGALLWRLSIAEIGRDGPYSPFPGVHRQQLLLSGGGFGLSVDTAPEVLVEPPHGQAAFDGGSAVECRLLDGPVHALNVFSRAGAVDARVWLRPMVGPMYVFPQQHEFWAVYVVGGRVELSGPGGDALLEQGDTALLGAQRTRIPMQGAGDVALVRFTSRIEH